AAPESGPLRGDRTVVGGPVPAFPARRGFDCGTDHWPAVAGYTRATVTPYIPSVGFGWTDISGLGWQDRPGADALNRDFVSGRDATFVVDVPGGRYTVAPTLRDAQTPPDRGSRWLTVRPE